MPKNVKTVIIPLNNRLLVEADEKETKTDSGLLLPEGAKEAPNTALVLAVYEKPKKLCTCGKCNCTDETQIKVGDRIIYNKWAATPVKQDGKDLFLVKAEDALAVIRAK